MSQVKKIAVLGGGIGSISAIAELLKVAEQTNTQYEITLYQMGWRLGGKGASGREHDQYERILEHGLHMWFGIYNNAFNQIKWVYESLGRPQGAPLATWQEAFTPESWLAAEEWFGGQWHQSDVYLPGNDLEPGGDKFFPPITAYLEDILHLVLHRLSKSEDLFHKHVLNDTHVLKAPNKAHDGPLAELLHRLEGLLDKGLHLALDSELVRNFLLYALDAIPKRLKINMGDLDQHDPAHRGTYIMLDLAFALARGIIKDEVISKGFDSINEYDLCEWLSLHGASKEAIESSFLRGAYDAMFAFEGGDPDKPNLEAGTTLKASMLILGSRGAVMYKMNAGMGDVIFAPAYELMARKGVKFRFFHRVESLELSADKKQIQRIRIARQLRLADGVQEYQPLRTVKGLPSWPSEPLYEQLNPADARALIDGHIDLESAWADWKDTAPPLTLELGTDFDLVICGTSIGPLPYIGKELCDANPRFKLMTEKVKTTRTMAMQLWMNRTMPELGWTANAKVMGSYVQPLNTWSDMYQVLDKEDWPADLDVKTIHYFCGPMQDTQEPPPYQNPDPSFVKAMRNIVVDEGKKYLTQDVEFIWPKSTEPPGSGIFNWNYLVDRDKRSGEERLKAQFFRANIDPSERYVLTVKGSSKYRLRANDTGFDNFYITGDWTDNGMNLGSVEACVISGMLCASAVSGVHIPIVGDKILQGANKPAPAPAGLYEELKSKARAMTDAVKDDPEGRLDLRKAFYQRYGGPKVDPDGYGFGDGEIGFMRWEIDRGVLNPPDGPKPGSPWWYQVNLEFLYWGTLSQLVYESGYQFDTLDTEVKLWIDYIRRPSSKTWYRAHNRCIGGAYIKYADLASEENIFERILLNEVLYRVLYSGIMEMGPVSGFPFQAIMKVAFDPALGILNIMEKIPAFYPRTYPLNEQSAMNVVYEGRSIADKADKALNELFIIPHIDKIYRISAEWLELPGLTQYASGNNSVYPDVAAPQQQIKGIVKGKVQSLINVAALDRSVVAQFLPAGLELGKQQVAPDGKHPMLIFFSQNRLHAAWFPWPKFTYNELAFLIPYVQFKGDNKQYAFTPILYVDSRLVSWAGEFMWKFNKLMARFGFDPPIQTGWRWFLDDNRIKFKVMQDDKTLATARSTNAAGPLMFNELAGAGTLREILDLPGLMGRNGKYAQVTVQMNYAAAEVLPVEGEMEVFELDGIPVKYLKMPFQAIAGNAFGGFRILWDLTLSAPKKL